MSDLVRFGVAMDRSLLTAFDRRIASLGYENRSEALRDLVRADLTKAAWDAGSAVFATLGVVLDEGAGEPAGRVAEALRAHGDGTLATLRVRLEAGRALEVTVLRGRAAELQVLAARVRGMRGVVSCELAPAAPAPRPRDPGRPGQDVSAPGRLPE